MKALAICALIFALIVAFSLCGCVTHITAETVKLTVTAKTDLTVKGLPLP